MSVRILRGMLVTVTCLLLWAVPTRAAVITYTDGACSIEANVLCGEWTGGGFTVRESGDLGSNFAQDWRLLSDWDNQGMRFKRERPFTLNSLDLTFGYPSGEPETGCAMPLEVRSSKGGFLLANPPNGDTICLVRGAAGLEIIPWTWIKQFLPLNFGFAGPAWNDIEWFSVEFTNYLEEPWPWFTSATVEAVEFVPEPSMSTLALLGLATGIYRRRRR